MCPQKPHIFAPLINEISRVDQSKTFYYDGSPVMQKDFLNTLVTSQQSKNYRKLKRSNDQDSIDGSLAAIMAVKQFMSLQEQDGEFFVIKKYKQQQQQGGIDVTRIIFKKRGY